GNQYGWWKDGQGKVVTIKPKQLLQDVRTWWDSTYQMLFAFISDITLPDLSIQPLEHYLNMPVAKQLEKYRLLTSEWDQVTNIIGVLQFPHAAQQVMSKEKTPVLAGAVPTFKCFMTSWEKL
ncbi:hypothetical protein L208DRAFT_1126272, partial [Tricholoma matsutake]